MCQSLRLSAWRNKHPSKYLTLPFGSWSNLGITNAQVFVAFVKFNNCIAAQYILPAAKQIGWLPHNWLTVSQFHAISMFKQYLFLNLKRVHTKLWIIMAYWNGFQSPHAFRATLRPRWCNILAIFLFYHLPAIKFETNKNKQFSHSI